MASLAPPPAVAQNVVLDEGTFQIRIGGQPVGTETFTIRRVGGGNEAHVIANAVVEMTTPQGRRELRPLLRTGADLTLSAYQVEVSGDEVTTVAVTATDRRFVARIRSDAGEREREFRGGEGTILLDETVAHQYYFIGPATSRTGAVPVIVPRQNQQIRMEVQDGGSSPVQVAGREAQARQLTLTGGGQTHRVWFDAEGRVLRVEIPAADYVAVRTDL